VINGDAVENSSASTSVVDVLAVRITLLVMLSTSGPPHPRRSVFIPVREIDVQRLNSRPLQVRRWLVYVPRTKMLSVYGRCCRSIAGRRYPTFAPLDVDRGCRRGNVRRATGILAFPRNRPVRTASEREPPKLQVSINVR